MEVQIFAAASPLANSCSFKLPRQNRFECGKTWTPDWIDGFSTYQALHLVQFYGMGFLLLRQRNCTKLLGKLDPPLVCLIVALHVVEHCFPNGTVLWTRNRLLGTGKIHCTSLCCCCKNSAKDQRLRNTVTEDLLTFKNCCLGMGGETLKDKAACHFSRKSTREMLSPLN